MPHPRNRSGAGSAVCLVVGVDDLLDAAPGVSLKIGRTCTKRERAQPARLQAPLDL
jgi:hypothetical protein